MAALQRQWVEDAKSSDLGLWWIVEDVRELLPTGANEAEIRICVSQALRPLLESGELRAVTLVANGGYLSWPGSPDEVLAQIQEKWRKLNRRPTIGDIVTFIGPRG